MKHSSIVAVGAISIALLITPVQYHRLSAQTKAGPTSSLNDQKTELTLKFPTSPPATAVLDAGEVEKLIETLAEARAGMKPPRPMVDLKPGAKVNIATGGRWWAQADGTGIDLAVLHPGYGWVGLYLDQTAIEELNRRLSRSIVHARPVRARHASERR